MHTSVTGLTNTHPRHNGCSYPEVDRLVNTPLEAMNLPPTYEGEEQKGRLLVGVVGEAGRVVLGKSRCGRFESRTLDDFRGPISFRE